MSQVTPQPDSPADILDKCLKIGWRQETHPPYTEDNKPQGLVFVDGKAEALTKLEQYYTNKFLETESISKWIYEATRVEAEWSKRPIIPEPWEKRDDKFRNQFVDIITKYMAMDKLPTPAEAHESWNQSYYKMGWKYGKVRDTEAKTHPDLVPFDELPQPEKDKDAIFLAFVWLATQFRTAIKNLKEQNHG